MEYTHLGRTGLTVSRLCLGTMNFGPQTSEPDAHAIMDIAHQLGINFFDTANAYSTPAAAISPAGTSRRPRRPPGPGTTWVWSASSRSTT